MKSVTFFPFLIAFQCSFFVASLNIPNQGVAAQSMVQPKNSTKLTSEFTCNPGTGIGVIKPKQQNCAGALLLLPSEPDINMFHTNGDTDIYQLPWFERYKDCEVLVTLQYGQTLERSSWTEVHAKAMELNTACVDPTGNSPGGKTLAGWGDKVEITIRGLNRVPRSAIKDSGSPSTAAKRA